MSLVTNDSKNGLTYTGATGSTIKFTLLGGKYFLFGSATDTSNTLNMLLPDGTSYQAVDSETTSAFSKSIDLPAGSFEIVTVSSTAVQGGIVAVPYNPAY